MSAILWAGSVLGLFIGLVHSVHLYRFRLELARHMGRDLGMARAESLYYGLWTLVLWTLFGSYVLVLWVIGALGLVLYRLIPTRRTV